MARKSKSTSSAPSEVGGDQFLFVDIPTPSNDNMAGTVLMGGSALLDVGAVAGDVLFTIGDLIFDVGADNPADALIVALDGAADESAEYAAFSSSVMFVFGDSAAEA